jgi:acyl-CoA synthetase (AMP-forming)/AMP-acid ligase II
VFARRSSDNRHFQRRNAHLVNKVRARLVETCAKLYPKCTDLVMTPEFVQEGLPKRGSGKILKRLLGERYWAGQKRAVG